MQYLGNLRRYGLFDHSELLACVQRQGEDAWDENKLRQTVFEVHSDTQTIYLLFDDDFRHVEPTRRPKYDEFSVALKPLIEQVSGYFDYQGWAVRCILTRLRSGGKISLHSDSGFSLLHAHRFHVPIVTNEGVQFTVADETVHMAAGEIWEINNSKPHSVANRGAEHRVHLILDWAEPMTHEELQRYRIDRQQHQLKSELGTPIKYD